MTMPGGCFLKGEGYAVKPRHHLFSHVRKKSSTWGRR